MFCCGMYLNTSVKYIAILLNSFYKIRFTIFISTDLSWKSQKEKEKMDQIIWFPLAFVSSINLIPAVGIFVQHYYPLLRTHLINFITAPGVSRRIFIQHFLLEPRANPSPGECQEKCNRKAGPFTKNILARLCGGTNVNGWPRETRWKTKVY